MRRRLAVNDGKIKRGTNWVLKESINASVVCVPADNPTKIASVSVAVKILDVNDNPPSLTHYLEAYVCENAKAGQVQRRQTSDKTTLNITKWTIISGGKKTEHMYCSSTGLQNILCCFLIPLHQTTVKQILLYIQNILKTWCIFIY